MRAAGKVGRAFPMDSPPQRLRMNRTQSVGDENSFEFIKR
jgi:hypothetical protein